MTEILANVVTQATTAVPMTTSLPGYLHMQVVVQPAAIGEIRRIVGAHLNLWDCADAADVVLTGVSELLTNVHRHAADPRCLLHIATVSRGICVEVHDRSSEEPVVAEPHENSEQGWGLWMLQKMADDFGCQKTLTGKCVWFRYDLAKVAGWRNSSR